jgi:hypothetical protein
MDWRTMAALGAATILLAACVTTLVLPVAKTAAAEDRLPYGLVYDANENNRGLRFSCSSTAGDELECEFSQISVIKKAEAGKLSKALEEARQQFRAAPKEQNKQMDCSQFENSLAALRGSPSNLKQDQVAAIQKLNARERQDLEKMTALLNSFCTNPTEENLLNLARLGYERDSKTCRIYTAGFTQKFKRANADIWISNEGPGGLCEVVTLSRLNRVTEATSTFWVYTTRSIVNNKKPEFCRKLDESEHFYDWRGGGDRFVGCDYIDMAF